MLTLSMATVSAKVNKSTSEKPNRPVREGAGRIIRFTIDSTQIVGM